MLKKIREILAEFTTEIRPNRLTDMAAELVAFLGEPRGDQDTVDAMRKRAARRLGISPDRVDAIWYRKVKTIPTHEANRIRICAEAHIERVARQLRLEQQIDALGREIEELNDADVA